MPNLLTYATAAGIAAFSGRAGGVSVGRFAEANVSTRVGDVPAAVRTNRCLMLAALDRADHPLVTAAQQHSDRVVEVAGHEIGCGTPPRVDGMVTREVSAVLMVGVADCVPVVLLAPGVGGVLHAGRRGILAGIVARGVAAMRAAGAVPAAITAVVGPAVGACCYPVADDVRGRFVERYPAAAAGSRDGRPALDLRAAVTAGLAEAGVRRVEHFVDCTAHTPGRFFSMRRDGSGGCQAGLVALTG